jgi:hypothetical protein
MVQSADGRFVATAGQDHQVRIWEVATFQEVRSFTGHVGDVYAIAFGPDGKTLASGSRDGTILIWDASGRSVDDADRLAPRQLEATRGRPGQQGRPEGGTGDVGVGRRSCTGRCLPGPAPAAGRRS